MSSRSRRGGAREPQLAPAPAPGARAASAAGEDVSVCLLTFNHVALLPSTLDSVLAQTLRGYELIVSDDSSDDGTWELIRERAARDRRIVAIRTPRNLGMAGNANFAARHCRRPLLAFLHHDDLYRSDLLEKWRALMRRYPDVGFTFNAYADPAGELLGERFPQGRMDGRRFLERHLLPSWGCPVRGTAMIRRDLFEALGGMREEFGLLADVDLWMRLSARAAVGYVREPLVTVRQERPAYYPAPYQPGWSWPRQRCLYEIHARNRREQRDTGTLRELRERLIFETRLSLESARWLMYALLRRKHAMLARAAEGETAHDQAWLRWLRRGLTRWARAQPAAGGERR